jgi:hypothetical protein
VTNITVEVTGDDAYERKLELLRLQLQDLRSFWPMLVPLVGAWMGTLFETEGASIGRKWAPLSPTYAREKARSHPGRSILIREGGLRDAASRMSRVATPRTLTMSIDDPVAAFHQTGTDKMPARPLIPDVLPPEWARDVDLAATEYVSTLVRDLGL